MDKPNVLAALIGRMQSEIAAVNKAFEAEVSDAITALKAAGSTEEKEKTYFHLRMLRGTYCQGAHITDEACEWLFPGLDEADVIVEPITKPAVH